MSTKKHQLTDKNKVVDVMVYNDSDQLMFHTTPPGKKIGTHYGYCRWR